MLVGEGRQPFQGLAQSRLVLGGGEERVLSQARSVVARFPGSTAPQGDGGKCR